MRVIVASPESRTADTHDSDTRSQETDGGSHKFDVSFLQICSRKMGQKGLVGIAVDDWHL
jgi:hypothetical protein